MRKKGFSKMALIYLVVLLIAAIVWVRNGFSGLVESLIFLGAILVFGMVVFISQIPKRGDEFQGDKEEES